MSDEIQGLRCTIDTTQKLRFNDMSNWIYTTLQEDTFDFEQFLHGIDIDGNKMTLRFSRSKIYALLVELTGGVSAYRMPDGSYVKVTLEAVYESDEANAQGTTVPGEIDDNKDEEDSDGFYTFEVKPFDQTYSLSMPTTSGSEHVDRKPPLFCKLCRRRLALSDKGEVEI